MSDSEGQEAAARPDVNAGRFPPQQTQQQGQYTHGEGQYAHGRVNPDGSSRSASVAADREMQMISSNRFGLSGLPMTRTVSGGSDHSNYGALGFGV